jgi:serine/threonine-protein kinase RsbW
VITILLLFTQVEAVSQDNRLQVQTSLDELSNVLGWFDSLYQNQLSRDIFIQCQTMLAEAFTNAVRHAHRNQSIDTPIDIEVYLSPSQLEIRVWDSGAEFNLEHRIKNEPLKVDPEATGGRGIQLLARLADSLSYQKMVDNRNRLRNCLQMIKRCR